MKQWTRELKRLGVCQEAIDWCQHYDSIEDAWTECRRGDWMLWYAGKMAGPPGSESRKPLVLAACECARHTFADVLPGEDRPRIAIETAESWARDQGATLDDVCAAASAASPVAIAYAYTPASAAAAAAIVYAYTPASAAAAAAAIAYAYTPASAAAADAIAYAAIVRKYYPVPPGKEDK